jgi:hypothetical protein
MAMPKKICASCKKENTIATKTCKCGMKFSKSKAKQVGPYVPTGKPRGRPPAGKKWDAAKKAYV